MAIKLSTGARNAILDTGDFGTIFDASRVKIYTGSAPSDADSAESGTLLVSIGSDNADTHCHFSGTASSGQLTKNTDTWSGTAAATGTAGYFRLVINTDGGGSSTTEIRLQGSVGTTGADLNMSSLSITNGTTQTIDTFTVTQPAS